MELTGIALIVWMARRLGVLLMMRFREGLMQHWSVTVEKDGETILTIESNCLSGKSDLTGDDEAVIRNAAEHLLSFVGQFPRDASGRDIIPDELPF